MRFAMRMIAATWHVQRKKKADNYVVLLHFAGDCTRLSTFSATIQTETLC